MSMNLVKAAECIWMIIGCIRVWLTFGWLRFYEAFILKSIRDFGEWFIEVRELARASNYIDLDHFGGLSVRST